MSWVLIWLFGLFLKAGLSPALRGAFVGSDPWIMFAEQLGDFFSQLTAVSTSTLIIVLGLAALRADAQLLLRLSAVLSASLSALVLFLAQRTVLPYFAIGLAVFCAGLVVVLAAFQLRRADTGRWVLALCGGSVLLKTVEEFAGRLSLGPELVQVATALAQLFSLAGIVLALHLFHRSRPLKTAVLVGLGCFLGLASARAGLIDSPPLFLIARVLDEMANNDDVARTAGWIFSCVAVIFCANLYSQRRSPTGMLLLSVLLVSHCPLTPLTAGILTLSGVLTLVLAVPPTAYPTRPQTVS